MLNLKFTSFKSTKVPLLSIFKNFVEVPELLDKTENIVIIDHHRKSADFIENATLTLHEAYASSACEMVAEMLQYIADDIKISNIEANSMYAGIMIDTNNFLTKTGVRTFEAAAFLRRSASGQSPAAAPARRRHWDGGSGQPAASGSGHGPRRSGSSRRDG